MIVLSECDSRTYKIDFKVFNFRMTSKATITKSGCVLKRKIHDSEDEQPTLSDTANVPPKSPSTSAASSTKVSKKKATLEQPASMDTQTQSEDQTESTASSSQVPESMISCYYMQTTYTETK